MKAEPYWIAMVIDRAFTEMIAKLRTLPAETLNRPMPVPDSNTLFAIGTHSVGMAEFWTLELVGGQSVKRVRDEEFRASGDVRDLIARMERYLHNMHALLDDLPLARLDDSLTPPRTYTITGGVTESLTVREALLHVLEHCATHLGHIQLTVDYFQAHAR